MIFFFCVLRYWPQVVWSFYTSLTYMVSILYHMWGKIYMSLNADTSYWPLLQLALKWFCFPNPSQLQIKIHLEYQVHITPWYNGREVLFKDKTSIEIFYLPQFSCCLKSFTCLVSAFHCFKKQIQLRTQKETQFLNRFLENTRVAAIWKPQSIIWSHILEREKLSFFILKSWHSVLLAKHRR